MQARISHLSRRLGLDLHDIPASNVNFLRTGREKGLGAEKAPLLRACWPVHARVIETLGVDVIVCLGQTAGNWVGTMIGATVLLDRWSETNDRRWTSVVHGSPVGFRSSR